MKQRKKNGKNFIHPLSRCCVESSLCVLRQKSYFPKFWPLTKYRQCWSVFLGNMKKKKEKVCWIISSRVMYFPCKLLGVRRRRKRNKENPSTLSCKWMLCVRVNSKSLKQSWKCDDGKLISTFFILFLFFLVKFLFILGKQEQACGYFKQIFYHFL